MADSWLRRMDAAMDAFAPYHLLVLRGVLAVVMFVHGVGKLFNVGPAAVPLEGFEGFLDSQGIPAPALFAPLVAVVETVAPLLILVGWWTRWAAGALAIDMAVAMLVVHAPNGFLVTQGGVEFTLVLLGMSVALLLAGPGDVAALERRGRDADPDDA